jgi:hypothetical protein
MRYTFMAVSSLFFFSKIIGQSKINRALKTELDSILRVDQRYRSFIQAADFQKKTDSLAKKLKVAPGDVIRYMLSKIPENDSSNMERVKEIIDEYGYPGKSLVGTPTNEAAFYVIQHSNRIETYLPIVEKAARKKELPYTLYATMLDRSLVNKGREQLYGTQTKGFNIPDSASGKKKWKTIVWPIRDRKNVNRRRKLAGFDQTVEENAKRLGLEYKEYSLEETKKMQSGN